MGRFHKSWVHAAKHRDSSIHLRYTTSPNFWDAFYWHKSLAQGTKDGRGAQNSLLNRPLVMHGRQPMKAVPRNLYSESSTLLISSQKYSRPNILSPSQFFKGLSKKATCLRGRAAEINFSWFLPMSTKVAAAASSKPLKIDPLTWPLI